MSASLHTFKSTARSMPHAPMDAARHLSPHGGRAAPNTGSQPVSGTAAELRAFVSLKRQTHPAIDYPHSALPSQRLPSEWAAGVSQEEIAKALRAEIIDGLGTLAALLTLACFAALLMALQ